MVFPPNGKYKLPTMPPEPIYDENLGEKKHKLTRRFIDARGYEAIHTEASRFYDLFLFLKSTDFE